MWLTGFVAGLAMLALVVAWLNGLGQPPLEEVVPAPLPMEPIVSAIDSAACRDRAIGAQYAMVCVDSQLLNTDDPAACDRFGGPYQIIVCPDPSRIAMGDTRPTIAAGGGSVILPLPPVGTSSPAEPASTPEGGALTPPALPTPEADEPSLQEEATPTTPPETSGELPEPAPTLPDLPQPTPGPVVTPQPAPTQPPGSEQLPPMPDGAPTITPAPTATPQADPDAAGVTPTATLTLTPTTSSEITSTPAPDVSATSTPSPVITLPAEGYVLTGAGQQTTPGLALTSTRLLLVRLTYTGAGSVAVSLRSADGSAGRLILQAAALPEKSGVIDIPNEGVYFIDVSTTSGGAWTLTVSQPVPPPQTPFTSPNTPLTGRGDQATGFVRLHSGAVSMRFEHLATGSFAVTLYDAETGRPVGSPLAQTIAPVQQVVTVPIPREGIYIFDVTATDVWSITIQ